jgi:hypothetical protein
MHRTTKSVDSGSTLAPYYDGDDWNNLIRNSKALKIQKERDDLALYFLKINTVSYKIGNLICVSI